MSLGKRLFSLVMLAITLIACDKRPSIDSQTANEEQMNGAPRSTEVMASQPIEFGDLTFNVPHQFEPRSVRRGALTWHMPWFALTAEQPAGDQQTAGDNDFVDIVVGVDNVPLERKANDAPDARAMFYVRSGRLVGPFDSQLSGLIEYRSVPTPPSNDSSPGVR